MKEIPLIGWLMIGVIGMIVLGSYISLLSLVRRKDKKPNQPSWAKSWRILTNPWEAENKQLDDLSRQVSGLSGDKQQDFNPDESEG